MDDVRERDEGRRVGAALATGAAAALLPFAVATLVGDSGATVGAVLGSLLLVAVAVAVWPWEWTGDEQRHRELEAIWRELRSDADQAVAWERYGTWAEADRDSVKLVLITCAPAARRIGGAPSPYSSTVVKRLDPDDAEAAAEAMEKLRADAAERELDARRGYLDALDAADREEHERALRDIDDAAAAELKAREQAVARELAQQEQLEREAQAEAVAKALRRP